MRAKELKEILKDVKDDQEVIFNFENEYLAFDGTTGRYPNGDLEIYIEGERAI